MSKAKQELKYLLATLALLSCLTLLCIVFPLYLLASGLNLALSNLLAAVMDDAERVKTWISQT